MTLLRLRSVRLLRVALLTIVLAAYSMVASSAARADYFSDHRMDLYTWHTSANIPSGWYQALINAVLRWDAVENQCHDFLRVATGSGQIPNWRGYIDGKGAQTVYAITTANHNNIEYDKDETWHLNTAVSPQNSSLDLWSVAQHEFGHTLALMHSGPGTMSETMYETYDYGEDYWRTLEAGDRFRIQSLYPPPCET